MRKTPYAYSSRPSPRNPIESLEVRVLLAVSPTLAWSSYLGGSGSDIARGVAVDAAGNVYVAGNSASLDWITGGSDTTIGGGHDAIVVKINPSGTLAWSTYLGDESDEIAYAIAVDTAGNVYVAGQTNDSGWAPGGNNDAFVTRISADGAPAWTTYLGGSLYDSASGIAVDKTGRIYVSGYTDSVGWTSGGFDTVYGGNNHYDGFIAKLEPTGAVAWSSYLGGANSEGAYGIAVDAAGSAFIVGDTFSEGWIAGGYDTTYEGVNNAFVAKVTASGDLAWSSYISASFWSNEVGYGNSSAFAVATDAAGNAYVTGQTWSNDFDYGENAFVLKIGPGGSQGWLSYYGGTQGDDSGRGIVLDNSGNIYIAGQTTSPDWVGGGWDGTFGGWDGDAFIAKLSPGGTLQWSSYLGGAGEDRARAISIDPSSSMLYVTGFTASSDWTSGGLDTTFSGGPYDAFIAKVGAPGPSLLSAAGTDANDRFLVQRIGDTVTITLNGAVVASRAFASISQVRINALAGHDRIDFLTTLPAYLEGGAGDDTLIGGSAADLIYGGDGDDSLSGGEGADTLYGNGGNDLIAGGLRRDSIMAGLGNDSITAGDGPDRIFGGDGADQIRGGKGADYIEGRGKVDTLFGGFGDDTILSGAGSDLLYGEDGNDWLYAQRSTLFHDLLDGGIGTDNYEADADDTLTAVEVNLLA